MKQFVKCIVMFGAFAASGVAMDHIACADPTAPAAATPGVVILREQIVMGNPRRPAVTIEVTRQRPNLPLHELVRPSVASSVASSPF